jgi:hypothetical protein
MFNFNGSDLGDISKYVKIRYYDEKHKKLFKVRVETRSEDLLINLVEFKNELPLIIDRIKKVFSICPTNYNIVKIDDIKYLSFMNFNDVNFKDYKINNLNRKWCYEDNIRKIIIFNWLMCIKNLDITLENRIYVRPYNFSFCIDPLKCRNVLLLSTSENDFYPILNTKAEIPTSTVKEWFKGSIDFFYEVVSDVLQEIDVDILRSTLTEIINKYNNDYMPWLNSVYNRITNAKYLSTTSDVTEEEY